MMTWSPSINLACIILISYLLGSISFSYLTGRILRRDIRSSGSGNLGAMNTARVLGPAAGMMVLVLDMGKGFLAAWGAQHITHSQAAVFLASVAVMLGHNYSIFLGFGGGKGIATAGGVLLFISPPAFLAELAVAGIVYAVTRDIHDGALGMIFACGPLLGSFTLSWKHFWLGMMMAILASLRHKKDFRRLYGQVIQTRMNTDD